MISTVSSLESGFSADVDIGEFVTVGHGALLTSCVVGNCTLIGQGAIIQEGSEIGAASIIAAGSVVLPGTVVPKGQLWAGNPAVFIRDVDEEEIAAQKKVLRVVLHSLSFLDEMLICSTLTAGCY